MTSNRNAELCCNVKDEYNQPAHIKVRTFWEAHKIWKNLPHGLDFYLVNFKSKLSRREFFQKQTNEFVLTSMGRVFICFFGRNWRLQKGISKLSYL